MFRRRTPTEPDAEQQGGSGSGGTTTDAVTTKPHGKGRPTPKRREAESRRRQPFQAPRGRKEAYRQTRQRQREQRRRMREGVAKGDERYLPARDKGSVRGLARNYVDSRRSIGEYFLILTVIILVLGFIPQLTAIAYNLLWPLMMATIVAEGVFVARKVRRLAEERHPGESTRGVGFYAAMRGLQLRRLRLPPPRVKVGEKI
ncbi:MAG: DUF3043 domain-containing protein [Streptosporangiales bacterium]|nr:DUF3043 domain-containing protein [Streptosporangiales bacterium]